MCVCDLCVLYLSGGPGDGPGAVHNSLVEGPGFEGGPVWLDADGLMM